MGCRKVYCPHGTLLHRTLTRPVEYLGIHLRHWVICSSKSLNPFADGVEINSWYGQHQEWSDRFNEHGWTRERDGSSQRDRDGHRKRDNALPWFLHGSLIALGVHSLEAGLRANTWSCDTLYSVLLPKSTCLFCYYATSYALAANTYPDPLIQQSTSPFEFLPHWDPARMYSQLVPVLKKMTLSDIHNFVDWWPGFECTS